MMVRLRSKILDSEIPGSRDPGLRDPWIPRSWARSRQEPSEVKNDEISLVLIAKPKWATTVLQPQAFFFREIAVAAVRWLFFVDAESDDPARPPTASYYS